METREKKTLLIGGIAAAVIILYAFVLSPLFSNLSRKRDLIPRKEQDLAEMKLLQNRYTEIQKRLKEAQAEAAKRGPLLTEIETLSQRANLDDKIASVKPQPGIQSADFKESVAEIKLENIALYDVVHFVYLIEQDGLRIQKLYFKPRYDNPKLLNATILVSSAG